VSTDEIKINDNLSIPMTEIGLRFSRSSGPGGQKVNRTATRVELLFDVMGSECLSETERQLILRHLERYIDGEGVLHMVSQETPSQWRNRLDVIRRFKELVSMSLRQRKRRVPMRPSRASRQRRLDKKRRRSEVKAQRGPVRPTD